MVMVVEVDKGYEQLLLWHMLLHGLPHYMLVQAIGFAHLSFHAVAVDGVVEVSFRHAHQYLALLPPPWKSRSMRFTLHSLSFLLKV